MPYRILMLTNSLGIGGAETHVTELALALSRKGHRVFVCSAGGVYGARLEACGITHFTLPLADRRRILSSAAAVHKIILENKIDIVHSHARIPSLVAQIACKGTKAVLAVTAHYNFKVSPLLSCLTRWGDSQLAVSRDLAEYLSENYGIDKNNVTVTVNGIDAASFREKADTAAISREFGLRDDDFVVLCVCRMDFGACKSVFDTLDIVLMLDKIIPDLKIVLVGTGNAMGDIGEKACQINRKAGKQLVITAGARCDIASFCERADVFVGVSRAAIEAMACNTPALFAGDQGFAGFFDRVPKKVCTDTNFTFRGYGKTTPQGIYDELFRLYFMDAGEKERLCAEQYKLVTEEYSTEIMADDAIKAYKKAEKNKYYDFLICGYYGFDNIGDDSMLAAVLASLNKHLGGPSVAVLTKDGVMPKGISGVHTVDRFSLPQVISAIKKSRVVMFGGGNLIQDVTSARSLNYYLALLKAAKFMGKKTMLYANGIGPVSPKNKKAVLDVLKKVDIISVREADSYNFLIDGGVDASRLFQTADEVFAVDDSESLSPFSQREYAVISLRGWSRLDDRFAVKLAEVLNRLYSERGIVSVFACLQDSVDLPVCGALSPLVEGSTVLDGLSRGQFAALVKGARFVLGMRLHSLVYACREAVPSIGIAYDKKVESFLRFTDNPRLLHADMIDSGLLEEYIAQVLDKENTKTLAETADRMKALAAENAKLAAGLLERN